MLVIKKKLFLPFLWCKMLYHNFTCMSLLCSESDSFLYLVNFVFFYYLLISLFTFNLGSSLYRYCCMTCPLPTVIFLCYLCQGTEVHLSRFSIFLFILLSVSISVISIIKSLATIDYLFISLFSFSHFGFIYFVILLL